VSKNSSDSVNWHPLLQRLWTLIIDNHLFTKDDSIIIAVSGGPDSIALLHLLSRLDIHSGLFASYIDHGLRPEETGEEIRTIKDLCNILKIPFTATPVNVHEERQRTGASLEESARNLRYKALESERIRHGASVIAVAHTADDQAEEVLLRLIRGSGRGGLSGMALKRDTIVRPLLGERKNVLLDYLYQHQLPFCLDSSNHSRAFLRNRVRLDLLPFLEANFNPSIRKNLLQTAEILRVEENLLQQMGLDTYENVVQIDGDTRQGLNLAHKTIRMKIRRFLAVHPALQRRVLEKVLWKMGTPPGFRQIDQIRLMMKEGGNGCEIHLGRGLRVWKTGEEMVFSHPAGRKSYRGSGIEDFAILIKIPGPGSYPVANHRLTLRQVTQRPLEPVPGELLLDADLISFPLWLRTPFPGERFRPQGAAGSKKISRFLSDNKIPRRTRGNFPVLVSREKILAVAGLRIDHAYQIRKDTRNFLVVRWLPITSSCA